MNKCLIDLRLLFIRTHGTLVSSYKLQRLRDYLVVNKHVPNTQHVRSIMTLTQETNIQYTRRYCSLYISKYWHSTKRASINVARLIGRFETVAKSLLNPHRTVLKYKRKALGFTLSGQLDQSPPSVRVRKDLLERRKNSVFAENFYFITCDETHVRIRTQTNYII